METVLRIIAALSFVAFVVGMFSPKTVKCSSRGKVALIFLGIFIVSVFVGASLMEDNPEEVNVAKIKENVAEMEKAAEKGNSKAEKPTDIPVLGKALFTQWLTPTRTCK